MHSFWTFSTSIWQLTCTDNKTLLKQVQWRERKTFLSFYTGVAKSLSWAQGFVRLPCCKRSQLCWWFNISVREQNMQLNIIILYRENPLHQNHRKAKRKKNSVSSQQVTWRMANLKGFFFFFNTKECCVTVQRQTRQAKCCNAHREENAKRKNTTGMGNTFELVQNIHPLQKYPKPWTYTDQCLALCGNVSIGK